MVVAGVNMEVNIGLRVVMSQIVLWGLFQETSFWVTLLGKTCNTPKSGASKSRFFYFAQQSYQDNSVNLLFRRGPRFDDVYVFQNIEAK